jgi:hypothetical protein
MDTESLKKLLEQYVGLHDSITTLKSQLKQLKTDFKTQEEVVHQFLLQHPGQICKVTEKHTIQLKSKTKVSGLNPKLIGKGFMAFHQKNGRPNVTDKDRDDFLTALKDSREKNLVQNVHVIIT